MKELSIEEKAKRYDEAYKVAKNIRIFSSDIAEIKRMEEIFPELKEESKGERIRKKICKLLWDNAPYEEAQEYIAWLEKQGEQKSIIEMKTPEESLGIDSDTYNKIVDECIYGEQKPADKSEPTDYNSIDPYFGKPIDKVEPKFHEGEWVVVDGVTQQVTQIRPEGFDTDRAWNGKLTFKDMHLWTIQDAKPGDVLVNQNGEMPFIFKECKNNHIYCYCGYTNRKDIFFDRFVDSEGEELHWLNLYHEQAYPATKEQRNTLMKAMYEAGYDFDFDKKELKKIVDGEQIKKNLQDNGFRRMFEQKPAWSEEDKERFESCIKVLQTSDGYDTINAKWLKSLKDRVGCEVNCTTTWKPSDEQMQVLLSEVTAWTKGCPKQIVLESLYNDLKRLLKI